MKEIIRFRVEHAKNREELLEKAREQYAGLLGEPDALIPGNAVIEFDSDTEIIGVDGQVQIRTWGADVLITRTTN